MEAVLAALAITKTKIHLSSRKLESRGKKDPINILPSDKKVEEGRRDRTTETLLEVVLAEEVGTVVMIFLDEVSGQELVRESSQVKRFTGRRRLAEVGTLRRRSSSLWPRPP